MKTIGKSSTRVLRNVKQPREPTLQRRYRYHKTHSRAGRQASKPQHRRPTACKYHPQRQVSVSTKQHRALMQ